MNQKITTLLIISFLGVINLCGQNDIVKDFTIYTSDVDDFWDAFSKLPTADNYQDSIKLIH
jgi:hypothetical protein